MGQFVGLSLLAFLRPSTSQARAAVARAPRDRARKAAGRAGSTKTTTAEKQSSGQGLSHGNLYAGSAAYTQQLSL